MRVTEVMGDQPPEDVYSETPLCPKDQMNAQKELTAAARELRRASGKFVRWVVGADRSSSYRGDHGRGKGHSSLQYQPHARGDDTPKCILRLLRAVVDLREI